MAETATTKSAALALADESALMRQGHQFLDEKRMLLAAEMLRALDRHRLLEQQLHARLHVAQAALREALQRHALGGLLAYPPARPAPTAPALARSRFLGVPLLTAQFEAPAPAGDEGAVDASPEARRCREAYAALIEPLARLAVSGGNLERLGAEYRRTERRARALENVLLPEIRSALRRIEEHLELADQEEAVRIRWASGSR